MRIRLLGTTALSVGVLTFVTVGPSAQAAGASQPDSAAAAAATPGASPENSSQVTEVLVTAQRRTESLSRVGVTVTAIGAKELIQRGVNSAQDLVKFVPGFQATQSFNGNPIYTLRGVGFGSTNAFSTAPVGVYVDEAAIAYPYMAQGLIFDLARVEVLKGPQGTLYGRNATGGLVDYVSAKPTHEFSAGFIGEAGSYQTLNATAFVSGPINDSLRLRLAVNSQNRNEGWQRSVTSGERLGKLHQNAFRLTADYGNGGPLTATLTGAYWKKTGDSQAPQSILFIPGASPFGSNAARASVIPNPTSDTQADFLSFSHQPQTDLGIIHPAPLIDSEFATATLKVGYRLTSDIQLVSLTAYDALNNRDVADLGGSQVEANFQDVRGHIRSASEELRLVGKTDRLNWSVGGYYADDNALQREVGYNDENQTVALLRFVANSLGQTRYTPQQINRSFGNYLDIAKSRTTVASVFADADYQINSLFKVTLGGRYTKDKASTTACTYDFHGGNVPIVNTIYGLFFGHTFNLQPNQCYTLKADSSNFVDGPIRRQQTQTNFSWRANVDVTPNDRTLLYASISRGFKAGGFPLLAASNELQFNPVKQEALMAYEVGAKLSLFDRSVQLNTSAFYYKYTDKQILGRVADAVFSTLVRIENVPSSRVYGFEGDATWKITRELTARVAGLYEQSKINKYTGFDEFSKPTDFAGHEFAFTPKFQGNASLNYSAPVSDNLQFNASVAGSYQSASNSSFAGLPLFVIKAHTLIDGTIGVASSNSKWGIDVYAKNLFNTYYWTGTSAATDNVFRYAGMPRQVGVRLSLKF